MVSIPIQNEQKKEYFENIQELKEKYDCNGIVLFHGFLAEPEYFIAECALLEAYPNFYEPIFGTKPMKVDLADPIIQKRSMSQLDRLVLFDISKNGLEHLDSPQDEKVPDFEKIELYIKLNQEFTKRQSTDFPSINLLKESKDPDVYGKPDPNLGTNGFIPDTTPPRLEADEGKGIMIGPTIIQKPDIVDYLK